MGETILNAKLASARDGLVVAVREAREQYLLENRLRKALDFYLPRIHEAHIDEVASALVSYQGQLTKAITEHDDHGSERLFIAMVEAIIPGQTPPPVFRETLESVARRLAPRGWTSFEIQDGVMPLLNKDGARLTACDYQSVEIDGERISREQIREGMRPRSSINNPHWREDKWRAQFPPIEPPRDPTSEPNRLSGIGQSEESLGHIRY